MPAVVCHLALVDADRAAARVARLGVESLEARAAVGPLGAHGVAQAAEVAVTVEALEMAHMPPLVLGFRALVGENYLQRGDQN